MPNPKEEEEMAKTTFRMPKPLLKAVKHYATDHEMTDTEIFVQALTEWIKEQAKKENRTVTNMVETILLEATEK